MGNKMKEIYLAGGCFWGAEKYLSLLNGVIKTEVGYANGKTAEPSYDQVCMGNTGHAETVKLIYDPTRISLKFLLEKYYDMIDPFSLNRQGNDVGTQYRTGIYYCDDEDRETIDESICALEKKENQKVAIQVCPLFQYNKAEKYHQKYLDKNPGGYCHIGKEKFVTASLAKDPTVLEEDREILQEEPATRSHSFQKKKREELVKQLTETQFNVTQNKGTEPPYNNEYYDFHEDGIYVDITTGEPLFVSTDKFESGCGWPSFSRPIDPKLITKKADFSHGMIRSEVRSTLGEAHLGHVFSDGPKDQGGLRYCINSASLRFVAKNDMEKLGYGDWVFLFRENGG